MVVWVSSHTRSSLMVDERVAQIHTFLSQNCPGMTMDERDTSNNFHARLYHCAAPWEWLVKEYDPVNRLLYGFVVSGLGPECSEWGYTELDELLSMIGVVLDTEFETTDQHEALMDRADRIPAWAVSKEDD